MIDTTAGVGARTHRVAAGALHTALVGTALTAGLFSAWDVSVMPGLARLDDRSFVVTFQALDAAIDNPAVHLLLLGTPLVTALAAVTAYRSGDRECACWSAAALGLLVVDLVVTGVVHLPLNAVLTSVDASGPGATLRAARETTEVPWRMTNPIRTVLCVLAVVCVGGALRSLRRRGR